MKFKCRMSETLAMRDFTNVVNAISKMSKLCVMIMSIDEICFTVLDDMNPIVWTVLSKNHFFNQYSLSGADVEQNLIYLEVDTLMLSKSLTTLKTAATSVTIKLTNKQQPCLTLDIEIPAITDCWQCVHDVPIRVVPRQEWPSYKTPSVPAFDITIDLPPMKHIRNVVERMKNMSPYLGIVADNNGMLILKSETNKATVATHFRDLRVWKDNTTEQDKITATIDIKRFIMFLAWDAVRPDSVQCNILHEQMLYLHVNLQNNIKINYFIPGISF